MSGDITERPVHHRRDARRIRRSRTRAGDARLRSGAGARQRACGGPGLPQPRRRRSPRMRCRADSILRRSRDARDRRQPRDPAGEDADARVADADAKRALRALGRDQPGRDGHRAGAAAARRASICSTPMSAVSPTRWRALAHPRATPLAGRTWLQQALPITFGLKAPAGCRAIERHRARLAELRRAAGAAVRRRGGTLASLGDARAGGRRRHWPRSWGSPLPDSPWHTQRDRVAEVATALGSSSGRSARSRATSRC